MPYEPTTAPRAVSSLKKTGKLTLALIGAAAGVLLLLFGSRFGKSVSGATASGSSAETSAGPGSTYEISIDVYRAALEDHIAAACRQVAGAGDVTIVVSLGGGFEYVYAVDTKASASGTGMTYLTVGTGAAQRPVFLTERTPPITGIGVICTGGQDPAVRAELTALLAAAYGLGSNRIYVTGRKTG